MFEGTVAEEEGRHAGGRLFHRHWPVDDPRGVVVIAHGYAEHSGRYRHVAAALVAAGLDTWAPDHRGHGRSEGAERANIESVELAVADLDAMVDVAVAASPGVPVFVLGHSMGGLIATAYAEAHQERLNGLVLSGPLVHVDPGLVALADAPEIPDLGLADAVSRDQAVVADYKADELNWNGPPPRGFLRAAGEVDGVRARFGELTLPLLVMHGSGDLLVSPQALRDLVAGVGSDDLTARLWPGLFHEIFNEPERAEVLAVLVAWISERIPRS
ncbi:MAG TPA: alpha/beta hydrolase [Acidimicrobiales bacterium]|nr:alpha/beta hydrolase [Acidimicrobiales bacterium]